MAYTKTNWANDNTPAINEENLNKIEQGIYDNSINIEHLSDEVGVFSIAKLRTNGQKEVANNVGTIIRDIWTNEFQAGDYVSDIENDRIVVRNTEILAITGAIGGSGPAWNRIIVRDEEDNGVELGNANSVLYTQNGYWCLPFPTSYYQLDKTKTYYVYLYCVGYNGTFQLNYGMGDKGTVMTAIKIK